MEFELTTLVMMGTNCTGSCKSNYHTSTTTMAPIRIKRNKNIMSHQCIVYVPRLNSTLSHKYNDLFAL